MSKFDEEMLFRAILIAIVLVYIVLLQQPSNASELSVVLYRTPEGPAVVTFHNGEVREVVRPCSEDCIHGLTIENSGESTSDDWEMIELQKVEQLPTFSDYHKLLEKFSLLW